MPDQSKSNKAQVAQLNRRFCLCNGALPLVLMEHVQLDSHVAQRS